MDRYTLYCTPEQTHKALELGAPLNGKPIVSGVLYKLDKFCIVNNIAYIIPTADQMIGWLEDQGIWEISITRKWGYNGWFFYIYNSQGNDLVPFEIKYSSRKEATLAAIDAALEYLLNNF